MVVPNGTLFGDGVAARIKGDLLQEFNLHTIVRLPKGVFAPYADIETNLLFFDPGGPTEEIWYYALPLPEGRKQYTKTKPLKFEEFQPVLAWWNNREENENAWRVLAADIAANDYNLDVKNPNGRQAEDPREPAEIVASILVKEKQIVELMQEIQTEINNGWGSAE